MAEYNTYFPVAMNLKERNVVIIGGDHEATSKSKALLRCEPHLTVISLDVTDELEQMAESGSLTWIQRPYQVGDLKGAFLCIVCDQSLGETVRKEADQEKVVLNVLDVTELCDFIAVANFSRDGLQIGIHSSGKSAALSRRVRERLEQEFGDGYVNLTKVLGDIRPIIKRMFSTFKGRRNYWLDVVNEAMLIRADQNEISEMALKRELLIKAKHHYQQQK